MAGDYKFLEERTTYIFKITPKKKTAKTHVQEGFAGWSHSLTLKMGAVSFLQTRLQSPT
jgi:hypothetical protein